MGNLPEELGRTTQFTIRCDVDVEMAGSVASDNSVVWAARVSTYGDRVRDKRLDDDVETTASGAGLIDYLMRNRHGTPFEHNSFTFLIRAPIFAWREFHRHRVGFSYNEESGRYKKLDAEFYVPGANRKLVQVGKAGHYKYEHGTQEQQEFTTAALVRSYREAYACYEDILTKGVTREVARMCLPVATYSSCYVTCNARSLMSFLSLRTSDPDATFPSHPMTEIEMVAKKMEAFFRLHMYRTWESFNRNGRVAP